MNTPTRDLIAVGTVVKVFGINGDVIVRPMTEDPERFRRLRKVFIARRADEPRQENPPVWERAVERVHIDARGIRLKIAGIKDRTEAGRFVGCHLYVDQAHTIPLSEGKFFVHDIIGLSVLDQEGGTIGVVKGVLRLPAHDVYVIDHHGREIMIPAVKEFVKKVDLASREMRVVLIDGMLEE